MPERAFFLEEVTLFAKGIEHAIKNHLPSLSAVRHLGSETVQSFRFIYDHPLLGVCRM